MPDDTPKQLSAEEFAAKVKQQYPAYAHVPNQELTAKILEKYPEYGDRVMAPGVAEARQEVLGPMISMIKKVDERPDTAYSIFTPTGVSTKPKGGQLRGTTEQVEATRKAQRAVTETGSAMVGGLPGAGVKGVAGVAARMVGTGLGGATGATVSTIDQGAKTAFWEGAKTGAVFSFLEAGGELLTAGLRGVSRLWKSDPKLVADAGDIISTEERTRDVVQTKAPELLKQANASYPTIPEVPIMPAARTAQQAEAATMRTSIEGLPRQVGKLADIGRQRQMEALRLLSRARNVLQREGATQEVVDILNKARKTGTMSAIDAKQVQSALGRLLSKGTLPGPQYQAVKETFDAIKDSIERVAADSGQLEAWQAADARVSQWHADFDNPGAPLKKIMDAEPDERGVVLKHLINDPETRVRAIAALERHGFNTAEINRLAAKYRDPTELNRAIEMTARMEQLTEKVFAQQETAATRKRAGSYALKRGAQLAGGAMLYELYKQLKSKPPNLLP
jgi:hypothetical protein